MVDSTDGSTFSYPVVFVGTIAIKNSLRLVDFDVRNEITREGIARVREAAKARATIGRKVPKVIRAFLGDSEPDVIMRGLPSCLLNSCRIFSTLKCFFLFSAWVQLLTLNPQSRERL